jgi:hypothetical protein
VEWLVALVLTGYLAAAEILRAAKSAALRMTTSRNRKKIDGADTVS